MRLCLIICAALLVGCGRDTPPTVVAVRTEIPADLLEPCSGWLGATPRTEGALIDAALAEKQGRECANGKLGAVRAIVQPGPQ